MGALAIVLWITAFAGGVFFPPLFILPMFATFLWMKQRGRRKALVRNLKENFRKCPRCAEVVKREALVCKHCQSEFAMA